MNKCPPSIFICIGHEKVIMTANDFDQLVEAVVEKIQKL